MARLDTIRIVISLAKQKAWVIYQLDVKSAFLHGEITEEVFVEQPPRYEQKGHGSKVIDSKKHCMDSNRLPEPGIVALRHISSKKASPNALMSILYSLKLRMEVKF